MPTARKGQARRAPQGHQPGEEHEEKQEIGPLACEADQEIVEGLLVGQVGQPEGQEKQGVDEDGESH